LYIAAVSKKLVDEAALAAEAGKLGVLAGTNPGGT